MECPKCKSTLHNTATSCGCGWGKKSYDQVHVEHINCSHDGCFLSAKVKIQTKTGWAKLCLKHYEEHYANEAIANLAQRGLNQLEGESKGAHVKRMQAFLKTMKVGRVIPEKRRQAA